MSVNVLAGPSYRHAVSRFDQPDVAAKYPSRYRSTWRDRRELNCILASLADVPSRAKVLDLPCGTGRLTSVLVDRGFAVTAADSSPHMLEHARHNWDAAGATGDVRFQVADVMHTAYRDGEFDAVICNRLFHHFYESETRRRAFRELGRICCGPIVVSFFNSFALDAVKFRLRNALHRRTPTDRVPIPLRVFLSDAGACGLSFSAARTTCWGVSPQWYVVLRRDESGCKTVAEVAKLQQNAGMC